MFSRWIIFTLIVLVMAPFALAEKTPAMVSSSCPLELGGNLVSDFNRAPAGLSGFLMTSDSVSYAAEPVLVADKPKTPPPPAPKPKPKSKSKGDKDDKDGDKG